MSFFCGGAKEKKYIDIEARSDIMELRCKKPASLYHSTIKTHRNKILMVFNESIIGAI